MSGNRRLPIRNASKSSYMLMRQKNQEFDAGCSFLELLPLELQENIFRKLSNQDIRSLSLVSKTTCYNAFDSFALMSRFTFVVPNLEALHQVPSDTFQFRKYLSVDFREIIKFGFALKVMPYLMKFNHSVQNVTLLNYIYSDQDISNILLNFPNLRSLTVMKQFDLYYNAVNGLLSRNEFATATAEQLELSYAANFERMRNDSLRYAYPLGNLHSLQVTMYAKFSCYVAATLKHITIIFDAYEDPIACQNVKSFLEHQNASLASLCFKNYSMGIFRQSWMFANNKICFINLNLKELIFDNFVIRDRPHELMNLISFIHSQQGSLVRLKFMRSFFLTPDCIPAFIAAVSRVKELIFDSYNDIAWLPEYLAEEDVRLNFLLIKNCILLPNLLQAINANRQKIGQLTIV